LWSRAKGEAPESTSTPARQFARTSARRCGRLQLLCRCATSRRANRRWSRAGEPLLALVNLATLDAEFDAFDEGSSLFAFDPFENARQAGLPPATHRVVWYRVVDPTTWLQVNPRAESSQVGSAFDARGFDALSLRECVARVRQIGQGG
jgi:hypothetical protein